MWTNRRGSLFLLPWVLLQADTVLHIQHDSTYTGQEVYLYNDQHDGEAHANCIAYSHECDSHVIIQLAATRVVPPACQVDFTDRDVPIRKVDCKNPPAPSNCSSTMFESTSNYVNMSIFTTVDPGRQEKEFLWIRAKTDTGQNVTVVCGASIPSDVSLHCPTSTSTTTTSTTTTTPTTTTPTTPTVTATATSTTSTTTTSTTTTTTPTITTATSTTSTTTTSTTTTTTPTTTTATSTTSTKQATMASTNTVSTQKAGKPQAFPSTITTSSRTSVHSKGTTTLSASIVNGVFQSTPPHQSKSNSPSPHPSQHPSGSIGSFETTKERISSTPSRDESSSTLPTTLGVSAAVLVIGFVLGWIMSRCYCQRKARNNGADVYDTTSTMNEEHTYSTARPASTATYANTSYEYYNQ
ncbi:uncharacterized protein [Haliotis asinina]|uniref:uncharacterized protein n=1 Tax=Haliotis asinina TaxID=109174 RepID=UPI00353211A6